METKMENEEINVRARQQLKAAITQYQTIGAKKIVLEGYKDRNEVTIAANIPISLAQGAVQVSAWMMISVEGESSDDWGFITDIDKMVKRMPKIEGDSQANINFQYVSKKGSGANLLFNDKPSAGKRHEYLPTVPLEHTVDYLPITYDDVAGAIHFNLNTGGSEGMNIHLYVYMNDFGNVLEARSILSQFGIPMDPIGKETQFAVKKAAPKKESKPKTAKKKEEKEMSDKSGLPKPSIATGVPAAPPKNKPEPPPVVEAPPVVEEEEVVPPVVEAPPVVEEEETVPPAPVVEETTTEAPPEEPATAPVEPPKVEGTGRTNIDIPTGDDRPGDRSKAGKLYKAIEACLEAGYDVLQPEPEEGEVEELVEETITDKAARIVVLSSEIAQLSKEIADMDAVEEAEPAADPELKAKLMELVGQL
jgi:hypothetical protein